MILKGLLAAGVSMAVAAVFPEALVLPYFGVLLGVMAGMYPGLAMADPLQGQTRVHWFMALLVVAMGLLGLWLSPALLAGAWIVHGTWAVVVGTRESGEGVPEGLPGFSLAFSIMTACFVTVIWLMRSP